MITMDIISKQITNRHDFLKFNPNKSTYYEIVNMILYNVVVSIILVSISFSSAFNTGYQYLDDIIDEEFAYHPSNGCGCRNVRVTAILFPHRGARQLYPGKSSAENSVPDNLVPNNLVPDNSVPYALSAAFGRYYWNGYNAGKPMFRSPRGFLLFYNRRNGWQIGRDESGLNSIMHKDSRSYCPTNTLKWSYYTRGRRWVLDRSIRIHCMRF